MENLKVKQKALDLKNELVRVGDIINFEGPLLSLFENSNNGQLYLYDWVDRDSKSNRWLIYKVGSKDLLNYLYGKVSHLDIFSNVLKGKFYIADITNNLGYNNYEITELFEIPKMYIPDDDSYFDIENCPNFEKIVSFVTKILSHKKQENEYSFDDVSRTVWSFKEKLKSNEIREYGSYPLFNIKLFTDFNHQEMNSNIYNTYDWTDQFIIDVKEEKGNKLKKVYA